jgi:hypothetical protein
MSTPNPPVAEIKAPELVRAVPAPQDDAPGVIVSVDPTQIRRPWRSTARTLSQAFVALCVLFPLLVENTRLKLEDAPWLAVPLAVAAAVARIMALPQVETFLRTFVPFLAAAPKD